MAFEARDYFRWEGSVSRQEFPTRLLVVVGLALLGGFLGGTLGIWLAGLILGAYPWACVLAQRCRNARLSPWLALLAFFAPAGLILSVVLLVMD